jgi:large subunit ribosomal protein L21
MPTNGVAAPPPAPARDPAIVALEEQLETVRRALATKDAEVRALLAQRDAGLAEIKQLRSELAIRDHQNELKKTRIRDLERSAEELGAKCADLEAELRAARERGPADDSDDLKLIRGIGPTFERELKRLGIRTFAQIAAWTDDDVEEIGPKIKARPERIRREDWVKTALELVAGKSNPAG